MAPRVSEQVRRFLDTHYPGLELDQSKRDELERAFTAGMLSAIEHYITDDGEEDHTAIAVAVDNIALRWKQKGWMT